MRKAWTLLGPGDEQVFRTTVAFINTRLAETSTLDWALSLGRERTSARLAVLDALERNSRSLVEPWRTGWRLIEESWAAESSDQDHDIDTIDVAHRIKAGERSGALVDAVVRLVRPGVKASALGAGRSKRAKAKSVAELMSLGLASGRPIDPKEIHLEDVNDVPFLTEMAYELDSVVLRGISAGERLSGDANTAHWRLGNLYRVYWVPREARESEVEPDEFHTGIAPAVKLLYSVVERLLALDVSSARNFAARWQGSKTQPYQRLWFALARHAAIAEPQEVTAVLMGSTQREFWDVQRCPELAELRAVRFASLPPADQAAILRRLRRGPPATWWPKTVERPRVAEAVGYWTFRELRRIQIAGGQPLPDDVTWMRESEGKYPELVRMADIAHGFPGMDEAGEWIPPDPDPRYDFVSGLDRLRLLEAALSERTGWPDEPGERAADWISVPGHAQALIADLELAPKAGADFPKVWERFTQSFPGPLSTEESDVRTADLSRIVHLLSRLDERTAAHAIGGISRWLDAWALQLKDVPGAKEVWLRLWPLAARATNLSEPSEVQLPLDDVINGTPREPKDPETLNTPAGRMIGVFLTMCPSLKQVGAPFSDALLRAMRDAAMSVSGQALLIVLHRFIQQVAYFLAADRTWTTETLVQPLISHEPETLVLWRAVARRTRFADVLTVIGDAMTERVNDRRLGRETRRSLIFSLVVECLHALRQQRPPAVSFFQVQQSLRLLDDEVRAYAANAVSRFVRDLSAGSESAEDLYDVAVKKFLEEVWPQEKTLNTPGVSRAFANLPACCGQRFNEAVSSIERFLVPFDSWSLVDYGLYKRESDERNGKSGLEIVDTARKAEALLRLLDATINSQEGAVVPHDLATALAHIEGISHRLTVDQAFRRLAALARR